MQFSIAAPLVNLRGRRRHHPLLHPREVEPSVKGSVELADYNDFSQNMGKTNGNRKRWNWYTHEILNPYFSGRFLKLQRILPPGFEKG